MQSIYTAGASSYSMSNLYKPAGVVNINASYNSYNGTYVDNNGNTNYSNGQMISKPSITSTSAILGVASTIPTGFEQITNTSLRSQNIDYKQNPINFTGVSPITVQFVPPIVYESRPPDLIVINIPSNIPSTGQPLPISVTLKFRIKPNDKNTYSYFTVIVKDNNGGVTTQTTTSTSTFTFSLPSQQTYSVTMTATDINNKVSVPSNSIEIKI
jgi:hypothetical protein